MIKKFIPDYYHKLVHQARQVAFYETLGVPDTLDGRFEMVAAHVMLVLYRFQQEALPTKLIATAGQTLYDTMFSDFDMCLREMRVGDLSVGRHIKCMVSAFHGRVAAYQEGLEHPHLLSAALKRNLYGTVQHPTQWQVQTMSTYFIRASTWLTSLQDIAVLAITPWPQDLLEDLLEFPHSTCITQKA